MSTLLELCAAGLATGAAYALVALGFVVIFRASEIFNFAHGEFLTIGAFAMVWAHGAGVPWPIALGLAMVLTGAVATGVERLVVRPMIGKPPFVTIILTIFVAYLLRAAVVILFATDVEGIATPWDPQGSFELAGAYLRYTWIACLAASLVALAAYFALLRYTRIGIAMRAASADQEVALALGIPVGRVFATTWFVAGMYAGLAGVFLAIFASGLDINLGYVALAAFPAVIVGGLSSPGGTVLAALLLGVVEKLTEAYLAPSLGRFGHGIHTVVPYLIMIGFLMVRPYGIFGRRKVERV
jgi:branched-chain amino acid transport system permease protein